MWLPSGLYGLFCLTRSLLACSIFLSYEKASGFQKHAWCYAFPVHMGLGMRNCPLHTDWWCWIMSRLCGACSAIQRTAAQAKHGCQRSGLLASPAPWPVWAPPKRFPQVIRYTSSRTVFPFYEKGGWQQMVSNGADLSLEEAGDKTVVFLLFTLFVTFFSWSRMRLCCCWCKKLLVLHRAN